MPVVGVELRQRLARGKDGVRLVFSVLGWDRGHPQLPRQGLLDLVARQVGTYRLRNGLQPRLQTLGDRITPTARRCREERDEEDGPSKSEDNSLCDDSV